VVDTITRRSGGLVTESEIEQGTRPNSTILNNKNNNNNNNREDHKI
jgi:hypothetical protein